MKYYCDYCDKQFRDTPAARKHHLSSDQHKRARKQWDDSIRGISSLSSLSLGYQRTLLACAHPLNDSQSLACLFQTAGPFFFLMAASLKESATISSARYNLTPIPCFFFSSINLIEFGDPRVSVKFELFGQTSEIGKFTKLDGRHLFDYREKGGFSCEMWLND